MKKRYCILTFIILLSSIIAGIYHFRMEFPILRNGVRDIVFMIRGKSVINTTILQEVLSKIGIPSKQGVFKNQDLEKVEELTIQFKKHYIKELDLSELRYCKNLKKLTIMGIFENGIPTRKRYVQLKGLEYLPALESLYMYDFPIEHLDAKLFPSSLARLHMHAIGVKNLINPELREKIPALSLQLSLENGTTYQQFKGL